MTSYFLPYATTPARAMVQAASDVLVLLWVVVWITVGRLVHTALSAVAEVGGQVRDGADGISRNMDSAGTSAGKIPLVGDTVQNPLRAAGQAAHQLAVAGQGLDDKASTLAVVLSLAVAIPPALAVVVPWLVLRWRFARRAAATVTLAGLPGGQRLLALRALSNRPLADVAAAVPGQDPLTAWREEDPAALSRLAALELRRAGLRVPREWLQAGSSPAVG